jgi:hypothetical protein
MAGLAEDRALVCPDGGSPQQFGLQSGDYLTLVRKSTPSDRFSCAVGPDP